MKQKINNKEISDNLNNHLNHFAEIGKISCDILHDLINPITGLLLYLEQNILDTKNLKEVIAPISQTSDSIRNFIKSINNNLLNSKTIDTEIDLQEIVSTSLDIVRPKIIHNKISVQFLNSTDSCKIFGNQLSLYQVILNLLFNAIDSFDKVADSRKKVISISLRKNKSNAILEITDNGSGIKKKYLNKIFENNFTTKEKGCGIGLYHIKDLIENHFHSNISFHSRLNSGSSFIIKFEKPNPSINQNTSL